MSQPIRIKIDEAINNSSNQASICKLRDEFEADVGQAITAGQEPLRIIPDTADRLFLAWDDDGGDGYDAVFEYTIPADGDYQLFLFDAPATQSFGIYTTFSFEEVLLQMKLILRIIINAIAIWITTLVLSGLSFTGGIFGLIIVAIIFGLINAVIRPIVKLLTLPINLVTLGLFSLVINTLMLMLTVWLSSSLQLEGNIFRNFLTAFLGAIIISVISTVLSWFLPDD